MSCPVCRKSAAAAWHPFCSRRCADVDLGRWLTGAHAIATDEAPGDAVADDAETRAAKPPH